jgi:hypothetical protein
MRALAHVEVEAALGFMYMSGQWDWERESLVYRYNPTTWA